MVDSWPDRNSIAAADDPLGATVHPDPAPGCYLPLRAPTRAHASTFRYLVPTGAHRGRAVRAGDLGLRINPEPERLDGPGGSCAHHFRVGFCDAVRATSTHPFSGGNAQ